MRTRAMMAAALLALAAPAAAAPVQIDFNVAGYGPAGAVQEYARHEAAVGANFTFQALDQSLSPAGMLWWDADDGGGFADGFGVRGSGYEDDEVEGNERLRLQFSKPLHVLGINYTDLFNESWPQGSCPGVACYLEFGAVMFYYADGTHSLFRPFMADAGSLLGSTNGTLVQLVDEVDVIAIVLQAPGEVFGNVPAGYRELHDFALAGVRVDDGQPAAVPEPGTLLLLGMGLVALARLAPTRTRGV